MFCRHVFGNISGGFRGISRFWGDLAEIPEFRGSATARNIRSPAKSINVWKDLFAPAVPQIEFSNNYKIVQQLK